MTPAWVCFRHKPEDVALEADMMQPDGIHPNSRAQPILMENVWTTLQPLLSQSGN